jgi:hypothetical protein
LSSPWEKDDYYSEERIEIIRGRENTITLSMQAFSRAKSEINICCDKTGAPVFVNVEPINIGYESLKGKR